MEVVSGDNWTIGAISCTKLQSNHHRQQTNIQSFYRPDALPVAQPSVKALLLLSKQCGQQKSCVID